MKLPRLPVFDSFIDQSIEKLKRFAFIKMTELKRSLDLEPATEEQPIKRARKLKNRKFALLLCYCGHGYHGLQRFVDIYNDL